MRDSPAFDDEELWFPAHMSAGDSFSRPLAADGAATWTGDDDGIGLPRPRARTGGPRRRNLKTTGGVKASSWLWLTLWGAAALGIATYAARKEIATEMLQSWLKGQGVPARLHFDSLSLGHAAGNFILGNSDHPDLSAGRFDAEFSLNPFATGGQPLARVTKARLDDVSLHLSYKDGKLGFGTLDRLVHTLSAAPKAPNAITVDAATVVVDSDYGTLRGQGSASVRDGRLTYLSLKLPEARLDGTQGGGDFGGGELLLREADSDRLQIEARLNAARLDLRDGSRVVEGASAHHIQAEGVAVDVSGHVPYRDDGVLSGPLDAVIGVTMQGLHAQGLTAADADYRVQLAGRVRDGAQYDGDADVAARVGHLAMPGVDAGQVAVAATGLKVHAAAGALNLKGPVSAKAGRISRAGATVKAARLQASRFELTADTAGSHTDFTAALVVGGTDMGDLSLANTTSQLSGAVDSDADSGAWRLKVQGDLTSEGGYDGLHDLARGRTKGDDLARLDRGLEQFTLNASDLTLTMEGRGGAPADIDLRMKAPAEAKLAGGLSIDLTPQDGQPLLASHAAGAFEVALSGGPKIKLDLAGLTLSPRGAVAGDYSLDAAFSTARVTGAKMAAKGHFVFSGSSAGGFSAALAQPLAFSAQSAGLGSAVSHVSGLLNPTGDSVLRADASGWRLDGAFKAFSMDAPDAHLVLTGGEGRVSAFSIAGSDVIGLKAGLDAARLSDALPAQRFRPLALSGTLTRDARTLTGRFTAETDVKTAGKPTPVLALTLDNDDATGQGQLGLRTLGLTFVPGGLQPRDLSPMGAAILGQQVSGTLDFDGAFRWHGDKRSSDGVLKVEGLSFAGALGAADKLHGEIDFTSLAPLQSRPNQVLGIDRVRIGQPLNGLVLSGLTMSLQVQGDSLAIDKATVETPGGTVRLEPMRVAFDPNLPIHGAAAFDGLDFGKIVAASALSNGLTFEGRLSGRVPFSVLGGHITFDSGRVTADGPGNVSITRQAINGLTAGGTLNGDRQARPAAVPPGTHPFQDLAYQAMEHLHYDQLDATIESRPDDTADAIFHFRGRFMPPRPQEARISFRDYVDGAWAQKPLPLPSDTPVDLYLDVPLAQAAK